MLNFICYPKCTTCQKAKKWLDDNGIVYDLRDIKTCNPTVDELTSWHKLSGQPVKRFFNTSGLLYKSLELKTKLPHMTDAEALKLLSTDGMLVKRPVLVGDDFVLIYELNVIDTTAHSIKDTVSAVKEKIVSGTALLF